jgi:endonuclease-3 related protein
VFEEVYQRLFVARGHQHWWPGETPFEVAVGAVLTQNTAWKNVEKAISNLKNASCMSSEALLAMPIEQLAMLIKPAGYYNIKAKRLKALLDFLFLKAGGDVSSLSSMPLAEIRQSLLSVRGIGRETADSIILYAVGKPIFVVDAYTRRMFSRLGLLDAMMDYDEIRAIFESNLKRDVELFKDYHAQIVVHGKEQCRKKPVCKGCPLSDMCTMPKGK